MRTTIDLPEDLLRRAKATAALRGIRMKDLIAEFVGFGLERSARSDTHSFGMHSPIPVIIPAAGRKIPVLTNAKISELLDREDDENHGRLP